MNVHDAIMRAADMIERNPHRFDFMSTRVPKVHECGTPGCALGWIGAFCGLGINVDYVSYNDAACLLGLNANIFYDRMSCLCRGIGHINENGTNGHNYEWKKNAKLCAKILRIYANKYHLIPSAGIPASVRAICNQEQSHV